MDTDSQHPDHQRVWRDYIATVDARGEALVRKLTDELGITFAAARVLDIGCGHGGFVRAAAQAGAEVVGIEIDPANHAVARARCAAFGNATIRQDDIMQPTTWKGLGRFDLVVSDNVIEHVFSAAQMIGACGQLLPPGGRAWITAPNAFSIGQVTRDCHYQLPAMSLADPVSGGAYLLEALGMPEFGVSWYERYAQYEALFQRYGFDVQQLLPFIGSPEEIEAASASLAALKSELPAIEARLANHPVVWNNLGRWLSEVEFDLALHAASEDTSERVRLAQAIMREHVHELWYFWIARR
ncbi:MAG: class I SAM-dependent methyltransferase [Hyphomonadaceae bacterium]